MVNMLYDIIIPEPSPFFYVICNYITVTMIYDEYVTQYYGTCMIVCDSYV